MSLNEICKLEGLSVASDDEGFECLIDFRRGSGLENVREESKVEWADDFDGGREPLGVPFALWFSAEAGDDVLVEQCDVDREVIVELFHVDREFILLVRG